MPSGAYGEFPKCPACGEEQDGGTRNGVRVAIDAALTQRGDGEGENDAG
jgi:hypothetical protein